MDCCLRQWTVVYHVYTKITKINFLVETMRKIDYLSKQNLTAPPPSESNGRPLILRSKRPKNITDKLSVAHCASRHLQLSNLSGSRVRWNWEICVILVNLGVFTIVINLQTVALHVYSQHNRKCRRSCIIEL